jgi:glycosyltransferase involved in cell wall biosynthesis
VGKRIVLDLRSLQIGHENRGIGMVIRSFLAELEDDDNEYIFYTFDTSNPIEKLGLNMKLSNYTIVTSPTLNTSVKSFSDLKGMFKLTFHTFAPLRRYRPHVFVQFDHNLGLPRFFSTKKVIFGYDVIPLIMKNEYLPTPSFAFTHTAGKKAKIKAVLKAGYYILKSKLNYHNYKRADRVIAISQTVKDSFVEYLHVNKKRIKVNLLAPVSTTQKHDDSILKKLNIKNPYVLYIGGTDSRKRIEEIVYAFNITRGRGSQVDLVLAGNELSTVEKLPSIAARNAILDSPYKKSIHLAGFITDEQKNTLYSNALSFIFCSIYEGFGLPIIEAQSHGCPVIAYDNSSIPETSKGAALLIETNNYVRVAEAIGSLFDEKRRQKMIASGLKASQTYSWSVFTQKLLAELDSL